LKKLRKTIFPSCESQGGKIGRFFGPGATELKSWRSYIHSTGQYNVLASIYGGEDMQAYRVETTLQQDGTLTLSDLPLRAGETVEVIILVLPPVAVDRQRYPLRGVPVRYVDPTESVAQADWEVAQ
jgi:hypothetical protein